MDELLGYRTRQRATFALGDELQHQVERRRSSRACAAVAVDGEYIGCRSHPRKPLAEGGEAFPVQCAAPSIEQARVRDYVRTEADAADGRAAPRDRAQPLRERRVAFACVARSGAGEQKVERARVVVDRCMNGNVNAIAGAHGPTVARE